MSLGKDRYGAVLRRAYELAADLQREPFEAAADDADRSLAVSPIFHPSAFLAGGELAECDRDAFRILAKASADLAAVMTRRVNLELKRAARDDGAVADPL